MCELINTWENERIGEQVGNPETFAGRPIFHMILQWVGRECRACPQSRQALQKQISIKRHAMCGLKTFSKIYQAPIPIFSAIQVPGVLSSNS